LVTLSAKLTATTATNCNNADFEDVAIFLLQLLQLQLKNHEEEWATCPSVRNFLVSLHVEW